MTSDPLGNDGQKLPATAQEVGLSTPRSKHISSAAFNYEESQITNVWPCRGSVMEPRDAGVQPRGCKRRTGGSAYCWQHTP